MFGLFPKPARKIRPVAPSPTHKFDVVDTSPAAIRRALEADWIVVAEDFQKVMRREFERKLGEEE